MYCSKVTNSVSMNEMYVIFKWHFLLVCLIYSSILKLRTKASGTCLSIKLAVSSPDSYQFLKGKIVKVKHVTFLGTSELINRKLILRLQNKDLLDKHWKNREGTN